MLKCVATYNKIFLNLPVGRENNKERKARGGEEEKKRRLINCDLVCHIKNNRTHMICLLLILENGGLTICDLIDIKCHSPKLVLSFSLKRPGMNIFIYFQPLKKKSSLKLVTHCNATVFIAAILGRKTNKQTKNQTCKNLFQAKPPLNSRFRSIKH